MGNTCRVGVRWALKDVVVRSIGPTLIALSALESNATDLSGPIALYYNERPPYMMTDPSGAVVGLTASRASDAFRLAGIPSVWESVPTNRQMALIRENAKLACAVGWFKNPEREGFAKYTRPIYRDRPAVALVYKDVRISPGISFASLLTTRPVQVLVKEGYSYGPYLDQVIAHARTPPMAVATENVSMVRMVSLHRADLMLLAQEEADYLVNRSSLSDLYVRLLSFPDMPQGELRYILCSKRVPDAVIERLNQVIADPDKVSRTVSLSLGN